MKNRINFSRAVLFSIFLIASVRPGQAGAAQKPVNISIADFEVQSKKPQFEYIGKGFTEFIGIDLAKSKQVTLIDREKRIELLKEQAFTLSGAADTKTNIAIGKLLSADYLVTGNIFDFLDNLTLTFRISNTTTGEIVYEDKVTDKLSKYDRISSAAAEKILSYLKVQLPKDLVAKANMPQEEKSPEVAINFSKAVDAYDKKDYTQAAKELKAAKELDPENTAVNVYINKLFTNTTRFKVLPEIYVPYQNPAYLGLIRQDKIQYTMSTMHMTEDPVTLLTPTVGVAEENTQMNVGYFLPVFEGLGVGAEKTLLYNTQDTVAQANPLNPHPSQLSDYKLLAANRVDYNAVTLSAGLKLSEIVSIGAGITSYSTKRTFTLADTLVSGAANPNATPGGNTVKRESGLAATTFGLLLKNTAGTLYFDSYYASTNQNGQLYSVTNGNFTDYKMPAIQENTLAMAFNQKRTFAVLKQTNYIYSDLDSSIMKITPAAEHWLTGWLALRAGVEATWLKLNGKGSKGTGYTAGTTISFKYFDFDLNYTNRKRPSRNLSDLSIKENVLFATISTNSGVFFKNK